MIMMAHFNNLSNFDSLKCVFLVLGQHNIVHYHHAIAYIECNIWKIMKNGQKLRKNKEKPDSIWVQPISKSRFWLTENSLCYVGKEKEIWHEDGGNYIEK